MGPGLNSTLALTEAGGMAGGLEASLDSETVVGGAEKERAGKKKVFEWVALRYE
jgi:hypothetical protein